MKNIVFVSLVLALGLLVFGCAGTANTSVNTSVNTTVKEPVKGGNSELGGQAADAALTGDWAKVKTLVNQGAEVNSKEPYTGYSLLSISITSRNKEMFDFLIEKGADVNAKSDEGWTPVILAAQEGQKDMVEVLVAKGANVNAKVQGDWTAIKAAGSNTEIVDLLKKNGATE